MILSEHQTQNNHKFSDNFRTMFRVNIFDIYHFITIIGSISVLIDIYKYIYYCNLQLVDNVNINNTSLISRRHIYTIIYKIVYFVLLCNCSVLSVVSVKNENYKKKKKYIYIYKILFILFRQFCFLALKFVYLNWLQRTL